MGKNNSEQRVEEKKNASNPQVENLKVKPQRLYVLRVSLPKQYNLRVSLLSAVMYFFQPILVPILMMVSHFTKREICLFEIKQNKVPLPDEVEATITKEDKK